MDGRLIFVATHHKTGTVWMRALFEQIASGMRAPFHRLRDYQPVDTTAMRRLAPVTFLFQDHARLPEDLELTESDSGWHLVRDPRDVLISAANYHGWSDEPWLHRPRDNLGGKTYHEFIRPLSLEDAVRFEMDRSAGRAIRDMLAFDRCGGCIQDIAYEILLGDLTGEAARPRFRQLGFAGDELEICLQAFRQTHARTGEAPQEGLRQHIQNLDIGQWRYLFDARLLADFDKRYPQMARNLGYPDCDPGMLVANMPRREAYVVRYLASRGDTEAAVERLEAALAREPAAPDLLRARELVAPGQGRLAATS